MTAGGGCSEDIAMNIKRIGEQQLVRKVHCFPICHFVTYATTSREVIIIPSHASLSWRWKKNLRNFTRKRTVFHQNVDIKNQVCVYIYWKEVILNKWWNAEENTFIFLIRSVILWYAYVKVLLISQNIWWENLVRFWGMDAEIEC